MCKLTIDDIHKAREENFEKTKNLTGADYKIYMHTQTSDVMHKFYLLQGNVSQKEAQVSLNKN